LRAVPNEKRQRQKAGRQARQEQIKAAQRRRRMRNRGIFFGIVAALVVLAAFIASQGGDDDTDVAADGSTSTTAGDKPEYKPGSTDCPKEDGSSERKTSFDGPPKMCIDEGKKYTATMKTSKGTIVMSLDPARAPRTVNNFVFLSRYHFYDGLTFHRVVPGFVIQGGDPQGTGSGGPGYKFHDELPKPEDYKAGGVAMANSGPNTNGSQFFILESDESGANLVKAVGGEARYSLFGQVTEGMDVVKAIIALGGGDGPPSEKVTIDSVTIAEA
jgi:cyclophilin family peptidyl-prolyl cis-trans isomerase